MPKATINGVELYYEAHGNGFPVVFTHGFAGTTWMWHPQTPVLAQTYKFIFWDARGHGVGVHASKKGSGNGAA